MIIKLKVNDEPRTMRTKSDNIEIMMGSQTNEIIEEPFESVLERHQEGLEESLRRSELFLLVLMHCIIILIK